MWGVQHKRERERERLYYETVSIMGVETRALMEAQCKSEALVHRHGVEINSACTAVVCETVILLQ